VRVEAAGLAMNAPRGWDVRIYRRPAVEPGAVTEPVLHAANFPLPVKRADYGGGVVERMGPRNVFVALLEFERSSATTPLFDRPRPRRLLIENFGPDRLQRVIPGQGGAQFFFNPIRPGSVATKERVIERSSGKELRFETVNGKDAKATGLVPPDTSDKAEFIKVLLPGPVPKGG